MSGLNEYINRADIDWCPSRQFVSSESCVNCERLNTVPYLLVAIRLLFSLSKVSSLKHWFELLEELNWIELNLFQQQKQHVNMMTLHINAVMYT